MKMKTASEIWQQYETIWEPNDMFGFRQSALIDFIPFEIVKDRLKDDADQIEWDSTVKPTTRESVIETMRDYMSFAWDKANGERGISSYRSIEKFAVWLWILEDDELYPQVNTHQNYSPYGKPILVSICRKYDFEVPNE